MISVNNKVILEPYKGKRKIEASVKSGFASVKQKNTIIGLKMLAEAHIVEDGTSRTIPAGCIAYISEETMFTNKIYQKQYECHYFDEKFIIVDFSIISFIKELTL